MSPRPLKPHKVDSIHDSQKGISVDIFFDRDVKDFFGTVGDKVVRANSVGECYSALKKAINEFNPFVWERFIEYELEEKTDFFNHSSKGGRETRCMASFSFKRFEQTESNNKEHSRRILLARPFEEDLDEDQRALFKKQPSRFNERRYEYVNSKTTVVPYTEELWQSLVSLAQVVDGAQEKLRALLDPKTKGAKLLALKKGGLFLGTGPGQGKSWSSTT